MRAIVIGGGIGGLFTAIALAESGVDAEVYEQSDALGEIGAGLQISANAVKAFERYGLAGRLAEIGVAAESADFFDLRTEDFLLAYPLGPEAAARYGARFYQVHRSDLLELLASVVPADAVHLGERCVAVAQDADGATARFSSVARRAPTWWSAPTASIR